MSGDYLWDGSGEPDPFVERLERSLRPLGGAPAPPQWDAPVPPSVRSRPPVSPLAAAAVVLLALAAALTKPPGQAPPPGAVEHGAEAWGVAWLEGASWPQSHVVEEGRLAVGQWLETRERRARLSVGRIGELRLEPATRVALIDAGARNHRLSLERGRVHATIWAPPGLFLVDTPAATAVDLGCSYSLETAPDGAGLLRVETGWVGLQQGGRQALVPAGASCTIAPGRGPGTPVYDTAPESLRQALAGLDSGSVGAARAAALQRVLTSARQRDALTVWHLLARVDGEERGRVYDRLAALVPPPPGVTREGILQGDRAMRDAWWDELGLGSAEFWRDWTRFWADPVAALGSGARGGSARLPE